MNARWVKSSFSFANGNCVEVAELPGDSVGIRDSRDLGRPCPEVHPGRMGSAFLRPDAGPTLRMVCADRTCRTVRASA